jgi:hypothetical protein
LEFGHKIHLHLYAKVRKYYASFTRYLDHDENGKSISETVMLHRFIMGLNKGDKRQVDHRNHDPLDNRKSNLRIVESFENIRHRNGANRNNKSGYRNVSWDKRTEEWIVQLWVNGKNMVWRGFLTAEKANEHAINMRKKYYGEFAGKDAIGD